ncbi:hypothetical protein Pmar_PMAR016459 [Perkinsus marinus ATCC 50983]|uniref:Uncharacterized protein n=1 Tax=Perkinsus marinus (strain ATCC 50983 / TXsc) TaxID=423536 RepID=C5L1C0_PERM5|nr:hypothetical protein Pmar_PMAR016459 [Perkinsus marinus ATCC 50983]EER09527.1 hypothetical protein Pmar_PMAR016459 [Perkinsus marinus ATCC 50983]|eukprot:XP_002777711.1 hypothetical protein Pmar_PMAR016459 [Perkinsus marinus ATCC 50983]
MENSVNNTTTSGPSFKDKARLAWNDLIGDSNPIMKIVGIIGAFLIVLIAFFGFFRVFNSDEAGQKQYAKAFIEKEKRDQWEQNQKWQERRNHRAVVAASAKEERVMRENYVIFTGEKGEENYVEGEEAGWYYCRLCKKKSATFEMLEIHIGSKVLICAQPFLRYIMNLAGPRQASQLPRMSTSESSSAAGGDSDVYATAAARGKDGEKASDGSKILARGDVSYGWPQIVSVASVEGHMLGQNHQKNCDNYKLPRYRQGGGPEQAEIVLDFDAHLGTKKAKNPSRPLYSIGYAKIADASEE